MLQLTSTFQSDILSFLKEASLFHYSPTKMVQVGVAVILIAFLILIGKALQGGNSGTQQKVSPGDQLFFQSFQVGDKITVQGDLSRPLLVRNVRTGVSMEIPCGRLQHNFTSAHSQSCGYLPEHGVVFDVTCVTLVYMNEEEYSKATPWPTVTLNERQCQKELDHGKTEVAEFRDYLLRTPTPTSDLN